ncbi:hypothetical protein [Pseudobacteriovorax antillogorgiicola]|uniref:Uncharacterized protein n=1 Tax=Pseudobacteriovorax antillogorgiicola TaxID=1513793 RepID=A0A1Y6CRV8_9BACT|nr:hypothetical protein [Pseudobacteriovorax antillogorgiicola]TCS45668.1 hypothetical protein EDD56_12762 [Pseudobacteriovorax antillogorgiicola]SMF73065.1 hypothetical protein SAMN06296036_12761 [Pseudobacteriovorax antillogorgiicola]
MLLLILVVIIYSIFPSCVLEERQAPVSIELTNDGLQGHWVSTYIQKQRYSAAQDENLFQTDSQIFDIHSIWTEANGIYLISNSADPCLRKKRAFVVADNEVRILADDQCDEVVLSYVMLTEDGLEFVVNTPHGRGYSFRFERVQESSTSWLVSNLFASSEGVIAPLQQYYAEPPSDALIVTHMQQQRQSLSQFNFKQSLENLLQARSFPTIELETPYYFKEGGQDFQLSVPKLPFCRMYFKSNQDEPQTDVTYFQFDLPNVGPNRWFVDILTEEQLRQAGFDDAQIQDYINNIPELDLQQSAHRRNSFFIGNKNIEVSCHRSLTDPPIDLSDLEKAQ